jgi:zinc transporter ZupT
MDALAIKAFTIGNVFIHDAEPFMFALVEGIAAGAMLTMIAQTMMPEAYFKGGSIVGFKGGSIVGFATLLGFIAAIISDGVVKTSLYVVVGSF